MKKWIILLVGVAVVVGVYLIVRQARVTPIWAMPKYAKVTRGDIRVPITAAGLIRANQEIEVKSMASGRITEVPVVAGDFVHAKDPVVVLDPIDEQRSRARAKADFDRAEAMLTQAGVAVERAEVAIETAKARFQEIEAQGQIAAFEFQKVEELHKRGEVSAQQLNDAKAQYAMSLAQKKSAEIAIRSAELSREDAAAAVKSQEAIVESAGATLDDAEKRFKETTVLAPQDAIVTDVYVRPGMLVQSATGSFTGGTPLMKLADVSKKKVVAKLDEADYGRVLDISPISALPDMPALRETAQQDAEQIEKRSGLVRITVDAFPEEVFEGRIGRVEPQGKNNPGSSIIQFDIHVEITDPHAAMLPLGAQAQVEFTVESAANVLRVPAEAVKTVDGQRGVYVKAPPAPGSDDKFGKRFVACRMGISDGEFTQLIGVLGGNELKEGDEVYTKLAQETPEAG
jgi:HlyD family secretion protein